MSKFYLKASANITPIEETTLADGTTKTRTINSNIDNILGASIELYIGTTDNTVMQKNISLSATATLDTLVTDLTATDTVQWLFMKMSDNSSAGEIGIKWGTMTDIRIDSPNMWFMATIGDSMGVAYVNANQITLTKVTGSPAFDVILIKNSIPSAS